MGNRKQHKYIDGLEVKECSRCKRWLSLNCFSADKSKWDGLHGFCKECVNDNDKKRYRKDPKKKYEKVLEYQIRTGLIRKYKPYNPKYYSTERSRAKKRARDINRRMLKRDADERSQITADVIKRIFEKYNGKCAYCGKDCSNYYEIEHKVPLSRGGNNDEDNLTISCKKCNSSKRAKTDVEFCGHKV